MKSLKKILTGTDLHPLRRFRVRAVPFARVSLFETVNESHLAMATHNGVMYFCIDFREQVMTATCEVIDGNEIKQVAQIRIWRRTNFEEATDFVMNSDLLSSVRSLAKTHGCEAAIYDKNDPNTTYFMRDETDVTHDGYGNEYMQIYIAFTAQQHEEEEEI